MIYSLKPKYVATSINPKIPTVVLIKNLPVFTPAKANSPWRILFGIVTTFDKLFNGSIEQVAIESFSAKKKLSKQREELKNFLVAHYGLQAWDDLIKEEGRIRKARQEAIYAREEQKRQIRDYTIIGIASLVGCSALGWMIWLISVSV